MVEEAYGASVPDLIEMAGTATFRRHERGALERVIAANQAAIITTAGGIVADPETYSLLLRRAHTVWIKAQPEDHMSRVMAQGDFRPMAQNRGAMADLVAILEARRADYARAEAEVDTSGDAVEQSFAKLLQVVTKILGRDLAAPSPGVRGESLPGLIRVGMRGRFRRAQESRSAPSPAALRASTSPRARGEVKGGDRDARRHRASSTCRRCGSNTA